MSEKNIAEQQNLFEYLNLSSEPEIKIKSIKKNFVKKDNERVSNPDNGFKNYTGLIKVKAYGNELFTIQGPLSKQEEETLLEKVREFGLNEFSNERTMFSFDKETGILCLGIKFQKKG